MKNWASTLLCSTLDSKKDTKYWLLDFLFRSCNDINTTCWPTLRWYSWCHLTKEALFKNSYKKIAYIGLILDKFVFGLCVIFFLILQIFFRNVFDFVFFQHPDFLKKNHNTRKYFFLVTYSISDKIPVVKLSTDTCTFLQTENAVFFSK